jgi:hypothetical protein
MKCPVLSASDQCSCPSSIPSYCLVREKKVCTEIAAHWLPSSACHHPWSLLRTPTSSGVQRSECDSQPFPRTPPKESYFSV